MSRDHQREGEQPGADPLLGALRELPRPEMDAAFDRRARAAARSAFARSFEPATPLARLGGAFGRVAMPVLLASVVGVYLTWAFAAATALLN